jgi:hypothetical protein
MAKYDESNSWIEVARQHAGLSPRLRLRECWRNAENYNRQHREQEILSRIVPQHHPCPPLYVPGSARVARPPQPHIIATVSIWREKFHPRGRMRYRKTLASMALILLDLRRETAHDLGYAHCRQEERGPAIGSE